MHRRRKYGAAGGLSLLGRLMRYLVSDVSMLPPATPPVQTTQPAERPSVPVAYRRVERFFTASEQLFYEKLLQAVGARFVVMSKVRMLDLVEPLGDDRERLAGKGRVAQSHVDYALLRPGTYEVVAALELDGRSHLKPIQMRRDEQKTRILASVGIPLLRFSALEVHTPEMIWARLRPLCGEPSPVPPLPWAQPMAPPVPVRQVLPLAQAPFCSKCGRPMVRKQKDRGPFWACPGFPQCRNTLPMN